MAAARPRSADEIRSSIEANRQELAKALRVLQVELEKAADWRAQLRAHRRNVLIGAAGTGFLLGGGLGGLMGLVKRR